MKNNILYAFAALLTLSACSSDIDNTDGGTAKVPVTVNASIGSPFTRSTPLGDDAAQRSFNIDDEISVSNGEESKTYKFAADGTWTTDGEAIGANPLTYTTFEAYYPVKDGNSFENGKVEIDQSNSDLTSSDFMTASTPLNPTKDNNLYLTFHRKTAKVTVNIVGYKNEVAENERQINSILMDANINVGDKAEKHIGQITMKKMSDSQFIALVGPTSPTDVVEGYNIKQFLTLFFENKPALHVYTKPNLEAGKAYTFNLTVGGNTATVESISVDDFEEGVTDEGKIGVTTRNVNLGTDVTNYETMINWLNQNIGDEKGQLIFLSGEWNDDYRNAIRVFTSEHQKADLTVNLSDVTGLESIPEDAFCTKIATQASRGLTGIILPNTVTSIGEGAFRWTGLKSIDLPEGINSIGSNAFDGTAIETLTVPSSLTIVSDNAFTDIANMKDIHFKGNVTSLGNGVFGSDLALQSIYLDNCTTVPITYEYTFSDIYNNNPITVYVKDADMLAKFKADNNWNSHGFTFAVAP